MSIPTLVENLRKTLTEISQERERKKSEFEAQILHLDQQEEALRKAIEGLTGTSQPTPQRDPLAAISQERLDKVVGYLQKHPKARQQDIAKRTKLNSGTVSIAVRRLERAGLIERGDKEEKSQVWIMPESGTSNGTHETSQRATSTRRGRSRVAA